MIIERSTGLVVDRLLAAGYPVVPVHPAVSRRPAPLGAWCQDDPGDSYKLADYLRTDGHRLRRLHPSIQACGNCRPWSGCVRIMSARTAASNQLGALLDAYWPGPKAMFCKLASDIAGLPADYPTPTSSRPARPSPPGRVLPPPCLPGRQATRRTPGPAAGSTDPIQRAGACGARPVDHLEIQRQSLRNACHR